MTNRPSQLQEWLSVYKKKVWSCFVYLQEGCGKTRIKMNDAIPHTRIDMAHRYTRKGIPRLAYNKNECCPLCPLIRWKLPHFLERTVRKHFQYVMPDGIAPERHHKGIKCFPTNNTHCGILPCLYGAISVLLDFWGYMWFQFFGIESKLSEIMD